MTFVPLNDPPLKVRGLVGESEAAELDVTDAGRGLHPDRTGCACRERRDFVGRQVTSASEVLPAIPGLRAVLIPDQSFTASGPHRAIGRNRNRAQAANRQSIAEREPHSRQRSPDQRICFEAPSSAVTLRGLLRLAKLLANADGNPRLIAGVNGAELVRPGA